mmetsp:Transcript_41787/g.131758  ORF Transcript_41787/g.131758 Transcript_41787/m.131758 type:complete len:102 (+) Transcript_41787:1708-2013(+)
MVASVLFVTRPSPGLGAILHRLFSQQYTTAQGQHNIEEEFRNFLHSTESMKPRNLKCKENVSSKKYLKAMFHHDTHPPICSFSSLSSPIAIASKLKIAMRT